MNKAVEFLKDGSVTLKTVQSPINGELTVKWDMVSGYQILGGGLWQVGGPVETVWKAGMKAAHSKNLDVKRALILGLGGGTTAHLIHKNWPLAKITGVDIDPLIVSLGNDYMGLKNLDIKTLIDDAFVFTKKDKTLYDFICVDTYVGDTYPEKLESVEFLRQVQKRISPNGIVIFNRIFESNERKLSVAFENKLKNLFQEVKEVAPSRELVNVIFVCSGPTSSS